MDLPGTPVLHNDSSEFDESADGIGSDSDSDSNSRRTTIANGITGSNVVLIKGEESWSTSPDASVNSEALSFLINPEISNRRTCANCHTDQTPFWRRAPEGDFYCNACGLYLRAHKRMRPLRLQTSRQTKRIKHRVDLCSNCQARDTPLWRRLVTGEIVCNACGLYYKLHGAHRPLNKVKGECRDLPMASGKKPRKLLPRNPIFMDRANCSFSTTMLSTALDEHQPDCETRQASTTLAREGPILGKEATELFDFGNNLPTHLLADADCCYAPVQVYASSGLGPYTTRGGYLYGGEEPRMMMTRKHESDHSNNSMGESKEIDYTQFVISGPTRNIPIMTDDGPSSLVGMSLDDNSLQPTILEGTTMSLLNTPSLTWYQPLKLHYGDRRSTSNPR